MHFTARCYINLADLSIDRCSYEAAYHYAQLGLALKGTIVEDDRLELELIYKDVVFIGELGLQTLPLFVQNSDEAEEKDFLSLRYVARKYVIEHQDSQRLADSLTALEDKKFGLALRMACSDGRAFFVKILLQHIEKYGIDCLNETSSKATQHCIGPQLLLTRMERYRLCSYYLNLQ